MGTGAAALLPVTVVLAVYLTMHRGVVFSSVEGHKLQVSVLAHLLFPIGPLFRRGLVLNYQNKHTSTKMPEPLPPLENLKVTWDLCKNQEDQKRSLVDVRKTTWLIAMV